MRKWFYFKHFEFIRDLGKWKKGKLFTHRIYWLILTGIVWIIPCAKL